MIEEPLKPDGTSALAIPPAAVRQLCQLYQRLLAIQDANQVLLLREHLNGLVGGVALALGVADAQGRFSFDLEHWTVGPPIEPATPGAA